MSLFGFHITIVASTWVFAWSASASISVKAELNPDPVRTSKTLDAPIRVWSTSSSGSFVLRLLRPATVATEAPVAICGGDCSGVFREVEQLTCSPILEPPIQHHGRFAAALPSGATTRVIAFPFESLKAGSTGAYCPRPPNGIWLSGLSQSSDSSTRVRA